MVTSALAVPQQHCCDPSEPHSHSGWTGERRSCGILTMRAFESCPGLSFFTHFRIQQVLRECSSPFPGEMQVHPARSSWCCPRASSRCSLVEKVSVLIPYRYHQVLFLPMGNKRSAQRQVQGLLWIGSEEFGCSPAKPRLRFEVNDQPVPFLGMCSGAVHGTLAGGC